MDHECLHESDLATMATNYAHMCTDIAEIKTSQARLEKAILGNGAEGLTTRAALNKEAIKRLWWGFGIVITGIAGLFFFTIRGSF